MSLQGDSPLITRSRPYHFEKRSAYVIARSSAYVIARSEATRQSLPAVASQPEIATRHSRWPTRATPDCFTAFAMTKGGSSQWQREESSQWQSTIAPRGAAPMSLRGAQRCGNLYPRWQPII